MRHPETKAQWRAKRWTETKRKRKKRDELEEDQKLSVSTRTWSWGKERERLSVESRRGEQREVGREMG